MTNCDMIRDLMPLYADGQASAASRSCIEEHTAHCPACKKLLNEMCAPLELEPEDRTEEILERLYKKQRRKTILFWVTIVLAVLLAAWAFMEIQFNGEEIYAASTNEEKILKEMPALALTDEELALAETILEIPEIQEFLTSGEESITLNTETVSPYLSGILPDNGRFFEVFVFRRSVFINIVNGKQYTCLQYTDADATGHIDFIAKTLAISPLEEIGEDGYLGDVKAVYELTYAVGAGITRCQKLKTRHIWFGFLNMP